MMTDKDQDIYTKPKAEPRRRIPEGDYDAVCIKTEKSKYLGTENRLYLHFQIIDDQYQGVVLFEALNIDYKSFPPSCKYYTDWSIANGGLPARRDKMSTRVFSNKVFRVKVCDVKQKYKDGTVKPQMFWYSKVERIIEKLIGGD